MMKRLALVAVTYLAAYQAIAEQSMNANNFFMGAV